MSKRKSKSVESNEVKQVIPPASWGKIVMAVLREIDDSLTIDVDASNLLQQYVEMEVSANYLLDATERRWENSTSGGPNVKNIEGAIKTYSKLRDGDVITEYNEMNERMKRNIKTKE